MMFGNVCDASTGPIRRMLLVGGFLGAGKTTLIGHFSRWLEARDIKVGLVTNDQGKGLMDTDSARQANGGGGVEEITGGCFCCRLDDLVGAVGRLDAAARPDVIVAEPVGSCTDLMATVILPLEKVYQLPFVLSPLSVVLDARRALATLGGTRSARDFHRDVGYLGRQVKVLKIRAIPDPPHVLDHGEPNQGDCKARITPQTTPRLSSTGGTPRESAIRRRGVFP